MNADAVWHSNRGYAAELRAAKLLSAPAKAPPEATKAPPEATKAPPEATKRVKAKEVDAIPAFVAPQLCTPVEQPPSGVGWCHEIKFDGYRIQLRVVDGEATLKTRKGLDWTAKFKAIAQAASKLPDVLIDGEIVALDRNGNPDFSTLQAAIADGKTDDLIFFAFDLLFVDGLDLRRLPLGERKQQLKELLEKHGSKANGKHRGIRYVEHFEADGPAVMESASKLSLEGIVSKKLSASYHSGR